MKPKIAIFDLTDCEGCELEFLNLKEKFPDLSERVEISNWRLISNKEDWTNIDYAFVEGTPIKPEEIELLKKIRNKAKYVIALGTCAATGGIPALIDPDKREKVFQQIYPGRKTASSIAAKPIAHYINIDFVISGCPANPSEIEKFLAAILAEKIPQTKTYPVCLPCKAKHNKCLMLEGKPCMGPVTAAGCNAICPTFGFPCFGCLGPIKDANTVALRNKFSELKMTDQQISDRLAITWRNTEEYDSLSSKFEDQNSK